MHILNKKQTVAAWYCDWVQRENAVDLWDETECGQYSNYTQRLGPTRTNKTCNAELNTILAKTLKINNAGTLKTEKYSQFHWQ